VKRFPPGGIGDRDERITTNRYSSFGISLCAVLLCGTTSSHATTCAPKSLVHIIVTDITPGIDATSFGAQPRVMYRIGEDRLRIEEATDAANGIHGLVVVAEPNIWMVNLYDGTGRHIVDPGPTFDAVAPVLGMQGLPSKLLGLEFGCEEDFIAENASAPVRSEQIGTTRFDVYRVVAGADAVEILERPGTGTPYLVRYYHQDKLAIVLRYDLYATGLPANPSLFVAPPGVHYTGAGSSN